MAHMSRPLRVRNRRQGFGLRSDLRCSLCRCRALEWIRVAGERQSFSCRRRSGCGWCWCWCLCTCACLAHEKVRHCCGPLGCGLLLAELRERSVFIEWRVVLRVAGLLDRLLLVLPWVWCLRRGYLRLLVALSHAVERVWSLCGWRLRLLLGCPGVEGLLL